jgi:hypothetical protein
VFSSVRPSGTLILLSEIEFLTRQVKRHVRGSEPSGLNRLMADLVDGATRRTIVLAAESRPDKILEMAGKGGNSR